MLEPLIMQTRAPTLPAANVGVPPGSGAADAGAFENMLQAGLAGRTGAATGMTEPAGPAVQKPAATPKAPASTAANAAASEDRGNPQSADDGASDSLAALLAYGPGAVATASPAAAGSEPYASAPAAAPALTDQHPDAATAALAAALAPPPLVQPTLGQPAVTPPATDMVPNRDGKVDSSATAATPASAGRTAGGDAPQRDRAAAAASGGRTPRDLPGIPGNQATGLTQHLPASTEAGTRTAEGTPDVTEEVRSARQRRSTGRDDLRNATESPGAARQRDGLQDPIRPAPDARPAERLTDRLTDRLNERAADRPADPAARIDAMVRTDLAPRLESPPPAPERAGPVPVLHVDHSLGSPEWQREFRSQVSVLVSRREPQAEIRLNPPQLGPVEVRIGLQGDQVSLAFTAPHPDTRAAIENALPQLREIFAGNGLALGNASVNAESSQPQSHRGTHQNRVSRPHEEPTVAESMPPTRRVAVRLVDTFA